MADDGLPGQGMGLPDRAEGDGAFASETVEQLRRRVVSAVRRTCPSWFSDHAEDIVQTVLIQLLRSLRKSEGKQTFSAIYLEKAAYGATVNELRRRSRRREDSVEEEGLMERTPAAAVSPERGAASAEIGDGIVDCLSRLARPRRLAATLYLHGCTVREAARNLGWTVKKTENLVYRGLADLRACLAAKGLKP
jgi:RNA polymerase sigma-70 factor (ECF subfamily)